MSSFGSQFERADDLFARRQFAAAFQQYCRLLEQTLHDQSHANLPTSALQLGLMERVADLAFLTGHSRTAADLFDAARAMLARDANHYAADWMSVKAASALLAAGEWRGARRSLAPLGVSPRAADEDTADEVLARLQPERRWVRASAEERAALVARLLLELGKQHAAQGNYRSGLACLERGLAHALAANDTGDLTRALLLEAASTTLEYGDLRGCRGWLDRRELREGDDIAARIRRHELEAQLAWLEGRLGPARAKLEQARAECVTLELPHAAASASLNLASLLILLNETVTAARIVDDVSAAGAAGDGALLQRAAVLKRLAFDRGQSLADRVAIAPTVTEWWYGEEAPASGTTAPPLAVEWPAGRSFLELFEIRALAFHWMLSRRDWAGARRYLDELDAVFGASDSMIVTGRRVALEGLLLYYEGQWLKAEEKLAGADTAFATLGVVFDRWQTLRVRGWSRERLGDRAGAESDRAESDRILASMGQSLGVTERAVFRLNKWTLEEETLARLVDDLTTRQHRATRHRLGLRAGLRRLASHVGVHARIDDYRRGVVENAVEHAAHSTAKASWWRVALRYTRRTACVRFVVLPDRVAILILAGTKVTAGVIPVTRLELRERLGAIHRAIQAGRGAVFEQQMTDLARLLQWDAVLAALPRRCTNLLVLPDDVLHGCPVAALGHQRSQSPSITIGFETWRRIARSRGRFDLLAAVPHGNADWIALPGATREAAVFVEARRRQRRPVVAIDPEAPTRAALLERLSSAQSAHIVCHGIFRPDRPDESGLMLIGAGGATELVSLRDLSQIDLSRLELLTLSSCWGADSFVLPGRFVISLPEVCWRAGARRVLASLWEVDDEVGVAFVERFYRYLDSLAPAEALARTRRDCRANALLPPGSPATDAPFLWAGFQLYGE